MRFVEILPSTNFPNFQTLTSPGTELQNYVCQRYIRESVNELYFLWKGRTVSIKLKAVQIRLSHVLGWGKKKPSNLP